MPALEPCAQPRQWRLQIMGDVVGDLAHSRHQPFYLIEHPVEIGRELVELVTRAVQRNAIREVSGHNPFAGSVHLLDAARQVAAGHRAADQPDAKCDQPGPQQRRPDLASECRRVADVAADQQAVPTGDDEEPASGGVGFELPVNVSLKGEG
jgi:hypothetical protein